MRSISLALLLALALVWVVALIGGAIAALVLNARLIRLLRERHPSVWTQIGSPSFGRNALDRGATDRGRLWRWVWGRKDRELNDAAVTQTAALLRITIPIVMTAAIIAIALAVFGKIAR